MTIINKILVLVCLLISVSCANYLDVVPDNVSTLNDAFKYRQQAQSFLSTCYLGLPNPTDPFKTPEFFTGDEYWVNPGQTDISNDVIFDVVKGYQAANNPQFNKWDELFINIRNCNIFLENISITKDIRQEERNLWIAEVKVIKAYLHFYLMELYGPIPLIKTNIPVSASPAEVKVYREPIDECVKYIVSLIDEAAENLPLNVANPSDEMGRITKPIALAIKAKVLVWGASPLFNGGVNGSSMYSDFKDNRNIQLIPTVIDNTKWEKARDAIKEAIDICTLAGIKGLYEYVPYYKMSDSTKRLISIRKSVSQKENNYEVVWPGPNVEETGRSMNNLVRNCAPMLYNIDFNNASNNYSLTLGIAEQFYSNHGVPIDEDKSWVVNDNLYNNRYKTRVAKEEDKYYVQKGEVTAVLNFDREPRFYASLGFDRGIFENQAAFSSGKPLEYIKALVGEPAGYFTQKGYPGGYFAKKLVSFETSTGGINNNQQQYSGSPYRFPIIRLADLYLLYSEALNETNASTTEIFKWIDLVRTRAGLNGVVNSWSNYSIKPDKPSTQAGRRDIIQRERLIEFTGEGQRFWDLRRWMLASGYLSKPMLGWNMYGENIEDYYKVTVLNGNRIFSTRDYLWPIKTQNIIINRNLVQNPKW